MKTCCKCKVKKPQSEFNKNSTKSDGLQNQCKSCNKIRVINKYKNDPETAAFKRFVRKLKTKFNISIEEYNTLKLKQNNCCAICDAQLETGMNSHLDHNHVTGKVRGLLCRWCNLMLGHAKDNTQTLKNAVEYLKRHS